MTYKLYAARGCGSAIVEIVLQRLGVPHTLEWLQWGKFGEGNYQQANPLLQVPTLQVGNELMTESLAICQWLNSKHKGKLVPAADDPALSLYYRWSVYLVATIYPTFFYGDHPERWVSSEESRKELRKSTDEARKKMWLQMEKAAQGERYFLGDKESLIDAYIAVMLRWRPGREWFQTNTPRLNSVAEHMAEDPKLNSIFAQFES
ncbi:MAG TPA: glutathione S-transferase [Oligoflexus sp.]|uniref:glutathione S-transferase family protein n=1 Tax=Oligoflexus sp. TaxID=1971216 RepID=UPI002D7E5BDF|nr:glutathione S-transferase [Oligoflexus sp.]HET9241388.1 glutathione S-transferase [Oligoflexus sp.]